MMKILKYPVIFLVLLLLDPFPVLFGQQVDPSTVNVGEITDDQIRRLINEMERNNLSEDEAIALARARGFSQSQINALRQRMAQVQQPVVSEAPPSDIEPTAVIGVSAKKAYQPSARLTRIFGFDLFNNENLTFEPSLNIPTPKDYTLGIGDEIVVNIWGASQQTYQLTINKNGSVNIPDLGPVYISGMPFEAAASRIQSRLTKIYSGLTGPDRNTYSQVSLGQTRSIKVNVLGEVNVPGTYTLPATATAFNALYLSGGPNERGSFRSIQIIRDDEIVKEIDVYDFLINGNPEANYPLRDQDIIMIPPFINQVEVSGEFKRGGIFETFDDETIAELLDYTGGFTPTAYRQRLELTRNTPREKEIRDVMASEFGSFQLQNGDQITAGQVVNRYTNRVRIAGAVMRPGYFELDQGMTLRHLIDKAEGLREDAYTERGIVTRRQEDLELEVIPFNVRDILSGSSNLELQKWDEVLIKSIDDLRQNRTVRIYGQVNSPGTFSFAENMTLKDVIYRAGGFTEAASGSFIEVARRLSYDEAEALTDRSSHIFQFNIGRDLSLEAEDSGFILEPFDRVFVYKAPSFNAPEVVTILGEVKYAGSYNLQSKDEQVSDLIERAGGLTEEAYPEGSLLTRRVKMRQRERRIRDELLERDTTIEFSSLGFEVVGIELDQILAGKDLKSDIILEDGDELYIPKELQTVKISGNVLNPISTTFQEGAGLKHYISRAGGFDHRTRKSKIYVIYPNGTADMTTSFIFNNYPKVFPGSEIIVPQKPDREPLPATAWIAVANGIASITLTVTTIVTLVK